ncbi:MAG: helix-turn-helix transcriptional regulator [Chlorobium sp.]
MKTTNFDDLLAENLKEEDFKKEYDALEEEFDVAKKIIHLRLTAGMTQKELARQAHTSRAAISQAAISRLESGTYRNVSLSFLRRVGAVFGVRPHVSFSSILTNCSPQTTDRVTWQLLLMMS